MKTTISRDTYLKALALSLMAHDHYKRCREMQLAVDDLLGLEDGNIVDDAIYSTDLSVAEFDLALKRSEITLEARP